MNGNGPGTNAGHGTSPASPAGSWTAGSTARYDADRTVAAFAARLKDAADLDAIRDDLADVVCETLEPAHAPVWINRRG